VELKNECFDRQRALKKSSAVNEISGIPVEDRMQVLKTAQKIYPIVVKWIKKYPVISPKRVPSVCLSSAATGFNLHSNIITQLSILGLVLFAIDDLADGAIGSYTDEQIEDLLSLYTEIVKSGGSSFDNYPYLLNKFTIIDNSQLWVQLANALAEFCKETKNNLFEHSYYHFFIKHFSLCMESWLVELHWRHLFKSTKIYPTYNQYLVNGEKSIGLSTMLSALLGMVIKEVIISKLPVPQFDNIENILDSLMFSYSISIRLANDICSFEREHFEQKPNSLLILMLANKLTEKEAEAVLLQEIEKYVDKADLVQNYLPKNLQIWGDSVRRLTLFSKDFYLSREFHNFSIEMLSELVDSEN
jgi:Terpene synthase family 2, C-terminal metal binding